MCAYGKTGEGFYFSVNTKGAFRATAPFILLCTASTSLLTQLFKKECYPELF